MDNFKIKSIEEFDLDFVANYNKPQSEVEAATIDENINIDSLEPEAKAPQYFKNTQQPVEAPLQETPSDDAPVTPATPVAPQPQKKDEKEKKPEKVKQSGVAVAGKVIATILLVSTVVTFVMGCFVSVFLDNNNINIGFSLNTVNADSISTPSGENIVSKGDLIISTKPASTNYIDIINEATSNNENIFIAYSTPPEAEDKYSEIYVITDVLSASEESAVIMAANLTTPGYETIEIHTNDKNYHGIVGSYIPALGGILHFAMDNAILVCILFILVAAFWCLVLILIDNQRNKTKKAKTNKKQ